ncbi:MAG TPA: ABC transporter ATP-binding protein [Candidatus Bathyarchaeota archaeon]|nr:ABC transporter ATP-binding protein [Candidatus Bathyarchaeota archaeon]
MALKVTGIKFSYDGEFTLENISFTVGRGEILVLLGPNGSGKTTLLKIVTGLLKPLKGTIELDGFNLSSMNIRDRSRLVSYVPQDGSFIPPYTVINYVVTGRTPFMGMFSTPTRRDYEIAWNVLKRLGMEKLGTRPITRISGGERRLAMIARALVQRPKLLALDEPTSHLDYRNQVKILNTVRELAQKENVIVILSLHDPNQALAYGDKVFVLSNGKPIAYGSPSKVIDADLIRKVYGVEVEVVEVHGRRIIVNLGG